MGKKLDFQKLKALLTRLYPSDELDTRAYLVADKESDTRSFESMLRHLEIRYKIKRADSKAKYKPSKATNHDTNIIMDALMNSEGATRLVLLSGDGDFADLLLHYKRNGKLTEVWAFKNSFSKLLVDVVDTIRFLDNEEVFMELPNREKGDQCELNEKLSEPSNQGFSESLSDHMLSISPENQKTVPSINESP